VRRVVVGLRAPPPAAAHGPGIDMQQVQCLVEQMGASLSPGARSLMEMVHFQQKVGGGAASHSLPLGTSCGDEGNYTVPSEGGGWTSFTCGSPACSVRF